VQRKAVCLTREQKALPASDKGLLTLQGGRSREDQIRSGGGDSDGPKGVETARISPCGELQLSPR
jgi:hypothetical protein